MEVSALSPQPVSNLVSDMKLGQRAARREFVHRVSESFGSA